MRSQQGYRGCTEILRNGETRHIHSIQQPTSRTNWRKQDHKVHWTHQQTRATTAYLQYCHGVYCGTKAHFCLFDVIQHVCAWTTRHQQRNRALESEADVWKPNSTPGTNTQKLGRNADNVVKPHVKVPSFRRKARSGFWPKQTSWRTEFPRSRPPHPCGKNLHVGILSSRPNPLSANVEYRWAERTVHVENWVWFTSSRTSYHSTFYLWSKVSAVGTRW